MTQSNPVRHLTILVLVLTLFFIPITDTLRAATDYDRFNTFPDGKVNTGYLNVRSGPGTGYGIVGSAAYSEPIYVTSQVSDCLWLEVSLPNGTRGWVYGLLVEIYRPCREFAASSISASPAGKSSYHDAPTYYASPVPYQKPSVYVYQDPYYEKPVHPHTGYHKPSYHQPTYQHPGYKQPVYEAPSSHVPQYGDPRNPYVNLAGPLQSQLAGLKEFSWQPNFALGYGEAFELIFWRTGQDPMIHGFSPLEASGASTVLVDLEESIRRIPQLQNGYDYVWSVLLIQTHPYQRLTLLSPGHQFRLEKLSHGGGGSPPGNGNTETPTSVSPPPATPVPPPTDGQPVQPTNTPFVVGTFTPTNTPTRIPTRTPTSTPDSKTTPGSP